MQPSLSQLLEEAAARHATRPAVLHAGGATSYAELAAAVRALSAALSGLGLGGRLGLLLPNTPAFPLALHGVLRSGGSALMLNPVSSPREIAEQLLDAPVDAVLTIAPLVPLLPAGTRALLVDELPRSVTLRGGGEERSAALSEAPYPPPLPPGGDREAAVLFTAADAGRARGAVLTHRNLVANLRSTASALQLTPDDRVLAALPLIHAFGLTATLNATLSGGAAMIPLDRFNPMRVLDLLEEADVTVLMGVPAMFVGLIAAAERRGVPRHSLRTTLSGGAPLAEEVQERWEARFGIPLRQGYGLTEAGPVSLFNRLDRPNRRGTLGYPLPDVEVRVLAPDGAELPDGEAGEICVRGENVFGGYLGDGGRDPRQFHGEWLRTGDLGSREGDGVIRFRGLLKPMFTRNGFNVYPREIERVLREDPRVAGACVTALPDPQRENEVVLEVRAAEGAALTEEEVRELCRARLAAYKQPLRVTVVR